MGKHSCLTFAAWFPIESAVSGFKVNNILKCKKLHKVRQVKIFFESANCTFGEQLQNTNAPLIIQQS